MAEQQFDKVPVTIITGFLGAGKTTLLNYLLQEAADNKNVAVIENEFGEVNIDSNLVADNLVEREDLVSLNNGCVCCSLRKDIVKALAELDKRTRDRNRKLDGVLLETTGLADPAPVAFTFFANPWMAQRFRLDSILCVVDVRHVLQHLVDEKPEGCVNEVVQQIAFSDVLLLNKTDLVTAEELHNVRKIIRAVNNTATILECQLNRPEGRPSLDKLIDTSSFSVSRALQHVDPVFLDSDTEEDSDDEASKQKAAAAAIAASTAGAVPSDTQQPAPIAATSADDSHPSTSKRPPVPPPSRRRPRPADIDHQHLAAGLLPHTSREVEAAIAAARAALPPEKLYPSLDASSFRNPKRRRRNVHDLSGVCSIGLTARGMLDEYRFNMFMRDLLAEKAQQIYRCKGVLAVHGYGTRKFVFQGVHETIVYGPADKPWQPHEEPVNQLVFIGKDLNRRELLEGLRTCVWVPLPEGWAEFRDEMTKQPYYYNRATQQKTWTRPQYACAHVTATKVMYHEAPKGRQPKRQASGLLAVAAVQQAQQAAAHKQAAAQQEQQQDAAADARQQQEQQQQPVPVAGSV